MRILRDMLAHMGSRYVYGAAPPPAQARPAAPRPMPAPPSPIAPSALAFMQAAPLSPAARPVSGNPAAALAASLEARGHKVLTRDGKLFVSNASLLLEDERTRIKELKPALLLLAEPWIEEKPTSLAQFLGHQAPPQERAWKQKEIPSSLPDNIILNYETNGLRWINGEHKPIGATVGTLDVHQWFLPWGFKGGGNLPEEQVLRFLREQVRGKHITNANTRFDVHMSRNAGVDLEEQGNTVSDIMHTAALLDDHRKRFALDVLAQDYLGGVVVMKADESRMEEFHAADIGQRAEYQAQLVAELRAKMYPLIDEQDLRPVHDLEDQVIYPVCEMEKNGAPLDMELLEAYSLQCNKMHDDLLWEIAKEVGFAFDHTASSWRRLFEHYTLPVAHLKSKKETYSDKVIEKIDHPVIKKARFAGQLASLNSKIFKAYKELIGSDGILHFDINQLRGEEGGTVSGRFSIGYVQQVPNYGNHMATFGPENLAAILGSSEGLLDMYPRRLFVPAPGAEYLEADAAQIQYRIFAHHANNPKVLAGYAADPRMSFHKKTMAMISPHMPTLIYEHMKNMNFMKIFGGQLVKTGIMMGCITEEEGEEIRLMKTQRTDPRLEPARKVEAIYARELPEVGPLLKKASHLAANSCDNYCNQSQHSRELHRHFPHRGFVRTLLGRRSRFPNNYKLYKAFCMIDQGSEGDIMKTKTVELHKERKNTGFLMRMTVHDQVSGDAQSSETLRLVTEILNRQSFPQLRVPILFECSTGANWAACK